MCHPCCAFAEKRVRVCWRWKAWRPRACSPVECSLEGNKPCKAVSRPIGTTHRVQAPQSAVSLEPWFIHAFKVRLGLQIFSAGRKAETPLPSHAPISLTSHAPQSSSLICWNVFLTPLPPCPHLHINHNFRPRCKATHSAYLHAQ